MEKIWIWFWSLVSGMGLISSVLSYKIGFIELALIQFALVLITSLIALKYLYGVEPNGQ